jgi:hypothetical protein
MGTNDRITRGSARFPNWVIGTILGETKDVDMKFTRTFNRPRFQVLVLDPAFIPISVDVVIGDYIYELHFKVEPEQMMDNAEPLDMDDISGNDGENDGKDEMNGANNMQVDRPDPKDKGGEENGNNNADSRGSQGGKRVLYHIPSLEAGSNVLDAPVIEEGEDSESDDDEQLADLMDDASDVEMQNNEAASLIGQIQAEMMAAIPEASTPSRRSKRRADTADQASLERAREAETSSLSGRNTNKR